MMFNTPWKVIACAVSLLALVTEASAFTASHSLGSSAQAAQCGIESLDESSVARPSPQREPVARREEARIDVLPRARSAGAPIWIQVPDATFIKLHFSKFRLPPKVELEVSNPEGTERYTYAPGRMGRHTRDAEFGDDGQTSFSSMSISGDTAVVRVLGERNRLHPVKHQVEIDYYMVGSPKRKESPSDPNGISSLEAITGGSGNKLKTQCGDNDRVDAACYEFSHAEQYDASRAVAKILVNGSWSCTAWRVGPDNRLLTNEHCIADAAELAATEVWFDYEQDSCGGSVVRPQTKVTGSQLLAVDRALDFTLFSVNDFAAVEEFGFLGLEVGEGIEGERIYIPQHGGGFPKQIAIASDMNLSGQCEIDATERDSQTDKTDLGYYCDTRGGSSGAPVVLLDSNMVIALHHYGGCLNWGVKMSWIWPQISEHFGGVVPGGGISDPPPNSAPQAAVSYACEELSCSFSAASSTDADGQIVSYTWNFGDGTEGAGANPVHTFAQDGSYSVQLLVQDDDGATGAVSESVTVSSHNEAPLAAYTVSCDARLCSFDGGLSSDPDGQIASYHWNFGDGVASQQPGPSVQHEFAADGSYPVSLTVWDNEGASGQSRSTITVTSPVIDNAEPIAEYVYACADLDCTFDASPSADPDGVIVAYRWYFDQGEAAEMGGPVKEHAFGAAGDYQVTLEVEDDMGAVSTRTVVVTVTAVVEPDPEPDPATIELSASSNKYRGSRWAELAWSGAAGSQVTVFRDRSPLATVPNSGAYKDNRIENRMKSAVYQVCEAGSSVCSREVTVQF